MSMIIENLTSYKLDPIASSHFAIACGARVSGGTNMSVFATAIAKKYGIKATSTNDVKVLTEAINRGAMAIANVGGNRGLYNGVGRMSSQVQHLLERTSKGER